MIELIFCSFGFIYLICIKGLVIFLVSYLFCRLFELVIVGLKRVFRLENIKVDKFMYSVYICFGNLG